MQKEPENAPVTVSQFKKIIDSLAKGKLHGPVIRRLQQKKP